MHAGVSVVVVTYNNAQDIGPCLRSILRNGARPVVVDNGSSDSTVRIVAETDPSCLIINNPQNGYARAVNLGVARCSGDVVVASNADVVYPDDGLRRMSEYLLNNPRIGVLGPQQVYPDGSWQRSWGFTPGLREAYMELLGVTTVYGAIRRAAWPRRVDRRPSRVGYLDGAVLVMSRAAFEAVGGFDERFFFYAEESDFCLRLQNAGWQTVFLPEVQVIHRRGGSSTQAGMSPEHYAELLIAANRRLMLKHHGKRYFFHFLIVKWLFNRCWSKVLGWCSIVANAGSRESMARKSHLHAACARQLSRQLSELYRGESSESFQAAGMNEGSKQT